MTQRGIGVIVIEQGSNRDHEILDMVEQLNAAEQFQVNILIKAMLSCKRKNLGRQELLSKAKGISR